MDGRMEGVALPRWQAGLWLTDGSLDAVVEINRQCLDYLVAMAAAGGAACPMLFSGQGPAWSGLSDAARARLAASHCLLVDAGFGDESRWCGFGPRMVHDSAGHYSDAVFTGPGAADFIRRVLVFGWHLAQANRPLARVVLGMPPACAERIAQLRLHDLDWLAEHRPGWVRPRWERQPRIWQHLLLAAHDGGVDPLTQVGLRTLQLMASAQLPAANNPLLRTRR